MSLSNDATLTMPVAPAYSAGGYGGNGSMWGGDWSAWIILFLIWGAFGGCWGNGFGGGANGVNGPGFQSWATRADINEGFALNNLQSGINTIQNGICDSTYTLTNAINNGFHGVDTAVCQLGYQTQQGFNTLASQLASCCCQTQNAIQGVRYDLAAQSCDTRNVIQSATRDLLENNNASTRAILDAMTAQRIEAKDEKIAAQNQQIFQLQLAASQADQNAVLKAAMDANVAELLRRTGHDCPTAAYVVQPPQPVTFPNYCNPCGACA